MNRRTFSQDGFTLFELLVAVLLLGMISAMIASVLSAGIKFADQGGSRILDMERESGLVNLLRRQVDSAYLDERKRQVLISAEEGILRLVTRSPLLGNAGPVLAVYRYNEAEQRIYYTEKRDFYNIDYDEEYVPDFEEMDPLIESPEPPLFSYDPENKAVTFGFRGREYEFFPRCTGEPRRF